MLGRLEREARRRGPSPARSSGCGAGAREPLRVLPAGRDREVRAGGGEPVVDDGPPDVAGGPADASSARRRRRTARPSCSTVRSARKRRLVSKAWVRSTVMPDHVHRRDAVHDPLGDEAADAAAEQDAERVQAGRDEVAARAPAPRRAAACGPSVKLSGPQNIVRTPASWSDGKRSIAPVRYGPIRSQSGGRLANATSAGMPSSDHGPATGSNRPTRIPPPSSR